MNDLEVGKCIYGSIGIAILAYFILSVFFDTGVVVALILILEFIFLCSRAVIAKLNKIENKLDKILDDDKEQ